ncbi:hypothetical protein MMC16_005497 [Acarospora aff. strigata]|nr:hypothetical protein [Acarospora aff. strigata]
MFEGGKETITSPSRGRSPTGSDTTNSGPRPLSKVRTSFVAVERSGQMAPQLGLQKISSDGEHGVGGIDGSNDPKLPPDSEQVNGGSAEHGNGDGQVEDVVEATPIGETTEAEGSNNTQAEANAPSSVECLPTNDTPKINGDKESSSVEDHTAAALPPNPEAEKMTTDDAATPPEAENLGSLLKGSAFEPSPAEEQPSTSPTPPKKPEPVKAASKVQRGKSPGYGKAAQTQHPSKMAAIMGKVVKPRPDSISTSRDATGTKGASKPSPTTTATKSPTTPQAPKTPVTPQIHPSPKNASPKHPVSPKETTKAPLRKPSRTSMASTKTAAPAAKPRQPALSASSNNPSKGAPKASPDSKVRPKSPTRPVRLPASATAPTASSVARLGGAAPARSPSRASTTSLARKPSTLKRDTKPSTSRVGGSSASNLQKKPSRPSLPLPNGHERPKSRLSNAGSKAPDDGFLARMMRPTASSASKTHEKVEPKTPPRKTATARAKTRGASMEVAERPKRDDAGHEQGNQQNGHSDTAPSTTSGHDAEQAVEPVDHSASQGNEISA